MVTGNRVGIDWGSRGRGGARESNGNNWDRCNRITIKNISNFMFLKTFISFNYS